MEDLVGEGGAGERVGHREQCSNVPNNSNADPSEPLPTVPFVPSPSEAKRATHMPLCFIDPQDAIRVMVESVGREARRQLLGELVRAWVDEIPEEELASHDRGAGIEQARSPPWRRRQGT